MISTLESILEGKWFNPKNKERFKNSIKSQRDMVKDPKIRVDFIRNNPGNKKERQEFKKHARTEAVHYRKKDIHDQTEAAKKKIQKREYKKTVGVMRNNLFSKIAAMKPGKINKRAIIAA